MVELEVGMLLLLTVDTRKDSWGWEQLLLGVTMLDMGNLCLICLFLDR